MIKKNGVFLNVIGGGGFYGQFSEKGKNQPVKWQFQRVSLKQSAETKQMKS